jgi:secondary thiamine-phosphate synthase enzyme
VVHQYRLTLPPFRRGFHLITERVFAAVPEWPDRGLLHAFILHTSAGLTINENADPSVLADYETIFNRLVPEGDPTYTHTLEGPDDMPAHVKATLAGSSVSLPIADRRPLLGTWQGIYLCEFRERGGARNLVISVWS